MTYLLINVLVTLLFAVIVWRTKTAIVNKSMWLTMIILLGLTAIFDSLIIWAEIVAYNPETLLGIYVGRAPIEDFFYSIIVAIMMPALWYGLRRRHANT